MERAAALAVVQSLGYDSLMTSVGRATDDSAFGYGPALDRAWAAYAYMTGVDAPDDIPAAAEYGFHSVLRGTTYDLLLPGIAMLVDGSVDAPLTSAKFSQIYKAIKQLRDDAWAEAVVFGYGAIDSMNGFKSNLDFLEPSCGTEREYG